MIIIKEVKEYNTALLTAINNLLPQLSPQASALSQTDLNALLSSPTSYLFIALFKEEIVGMLTLLHHPIPTGYRTLIEDVVIDSTMRGKGLGKQLLITAINRAKSIGAQNINLTSHPTRIAANKLYQKLGFITRTTNVYRLEL